MSTLTIKEYFALAGTRFSNDDARVIGPVLQELAADGDVTAEAVVKAAHSQNCPLHEYFEWDNQTAAGLYREGQAREMIQSVRVRFVSNGQEYATRAYNISVRKQENSLPREVPVTNVLPHPVEQLLESVRELDAWRLKYAHLRMMRRVGDVLVPVMNQIDEFKEEVAAGGLPADAESELLVLNEWRADVSDKIAITTACGEHIGYMNDAIDAAWEAVGDLKRDKFTRDKIIERENDELRERVAFLEDLLAEKIWLPVELGLTKAEEAVVQTLLSRDVMSRDQAMHALYSGRPNEVPEMKIIDVLICKIRKKVEPFGIKIDTHWGRGWLMPAEAKQELRGLIEARKAAA